MKTFWTRAVAAACLIAGAAGALAQAPYPSKPMTWIVPFAAGGPTDALARDIAEKVQRQLGQTIVIENQGGAGGTIGAGKAARAQPTATPSSWGTWATWPPRPRCTRS